MTFYMWADPPLAENSKQITNYKQKENLEQEQN